MNVVEALGASFMATRRAQSMGLLPHRKLDAAIREALDTNGIIYTRRLDPVGAITFVTGEGPALTPRQAADTFLADRGGFDGLMDSFTK
jgi:hypothetical protein